MKKITIFLLLTTATISQSFAQKDAEARAILNKVSQKYHAYNIIKSDFSFDIEDQQSHIEQTQQGTLIVQAKTNKYKLILYDQGSNTSVGQEMISNGTDQWTYLAKDKEVQLNKADNGDEGFNPAKIFTIYEKGYKYIYTGDETLKGHVCQVIDLTPEGDKEFFKIRLWIDKAKKEIYSALIFDKNGGRFTYTIHSFTPDAQVPEIAFTYNSKEHPGVEVVDLR